MFSLLMSYCHAECKKMLSTYSLQAGFPSKGTYCGVKGGDKL